MADLIYSEIIQYALHIWYIDAVFFWAITKHSDQLFRIANYCMGNITYSLFPKPSDIIDPRTIDNLFYPIKFRNSYQVFIQTI